MLIVTARKRALELVNLLSMKVIHLKLAKLYLRRAANFYRGLYGGEHKLAAHHTNVCKNSPLCEDISSLDFSKSLSNSATLLVLRRFL